MIEQETLGALKLLDSRLAQLVEAARLHDRRLLALREKVGWLDAARAMDADRIARLRLTVDGLLNQNAARQDVLTAMKEEAYGL